MSKQPEIPYGLSREQYLFLPFAVEVPLEEEFDELDWIDAAYSISAVVQAVWKGTASVEDILDCANDTGALDIDRYIEAAEDATEEHAELILYGVH